MFLYIHIISSTNIVLSHECSSNRYDGASFNYYPTIVIDPSMTLSSSAFWYWQQGNRQLGDSTKCLLDGILLHRLGFRSLPNRHELSFHS